MLLERLDRLTRADPAAAGMLFLKLIRSGITLVTVSNKREYNDSNTASLGGLLEPIALLCSGYEESKKKSEWLASHYKGRRQAKAPVVAHVAPAWLEKLPNREGYEVNPEAAETITKIFDACILGLGSTAIMRKAIAEEWPENVIKWHQASIAGLLRDRRLIGEYQPHIVAPGKEPGKQIRIPADAAWQGHYPPAISVELFYQAQAAIDERRALPGRRDKTYRNVLRGIAFCGYCGAPLHLRYRPANKGGDSLRCADTMRGLSKCPAYQTKKLWPRVLPELLEYAHDQVIRQKAEIEARNKLEIAKGELEVLRKGLETLIDLGVASGSSKAIAARIAKQEMHFDTQQNKVDELQARLASSRIGAFDEQKIQEAIKAALAAVADPDASEERAKLHADLARSVKTLLFRKEFVAVELYWSDFAASIQSGSGFISLTDGGTNLLTTDLQMNEENIKKYRLTPEQAASGVMFFTPIQLPKAKRRKHRM